MNLSLKDKLKPVYLENFLIFLSSCVIAFFFLLKSPLHPWIGGTTSTDSSVFKTVVLMMEKGGMPYKDSFDHKGPLLYIINWLGNQIASYRGVWVIEFIFMVITLFMIYKIARLLCSKNSAIVVTFLAISLLFGYFEGGNFTEEYGMAFIAISLFIFLDYFKNNKISNFRLIVCGFSLAGTLLLRPNMISLWVVMCIGVFIQITLTKEWHNLKKFIIWFSLGVAILLVPILIWLGVNGALKQCWLDYIIFNREYTSKESGRATLSNQWNSFFTFFNTSVYMVSFFALFFLRRSKNYFFNVVYLLYMLITLLFICLSGMTYGHYGMILIPLVSYPLGLLFSEIEKIEIQNIAQIILTILSIYFISTHIMPNWINLIKTLPSSYVNRTKTHREGTVNEIANIIKTHTSENDTISVYGNWDTVYITSERPHATRYSYQSPIGVVMPKIMNEYLTQLQAELPKIIVVQAGRKDDTISNFLENNKYELIWSQNGESLDGALIYYKEF